MHPDLSDSCTCDFRRKPTVLRFPVEQYSGSNRAEDLRSCRYGRATFLYPEACEPSVEVPPLFNSICHHLSRKIELCALAARGRSESCLWAIREGHKSRNTYLCLPRCLLIEKHRKNRNPTGNTLRNSNLLFENIYSPKSLFLALRTPIYANASQVGTLGHALLSELCRGSYGLEGSKNFRKTWHLIFRQLFHTQILRRWTS